MNANAQDFDPSPFGEAAPNDTGYQQQPYAGGYGMQQEMPHYGVQASMESGGAYYDPSVGYQQDYNAYYPQTDYTSDPAAAPWNEPPIAATLVPGSYYPTVPNIIQPQLYGAPISALAYDDEYEAIYVASQTQPFNRKRRASMMVTHSTLDGMLYSSCAAHAEADQSTLRTLY